jgi:hypothetical protein
MLGITSSSRLLRVILLPVSVASGLGKRVSAVIVDQMFWTWFLALVVRCFHLWQVKLWLVKAYLDLVESSFEHRSIRYSAIVYM